MIPLDIISDPICPWCYIGKARLEAAIAEAGANPFAIRWRPFQLNPDMPREGMDRRAYLDAKFGPEQARAFYAKIEQTAIAAGLEVNFAAITRTPNTIDAHRLIRWAEAEDVQDQIVTALFAAYFTKGADISDPETLSALAASAGMDAALTTRLLKSDADAEDIREEDRQYREMGVSGVPTFVVAGRHVVTGAQEADLWSQVIRELTQDPS